MTLVAEGVVFWVKGKDILMVAFVTRNRFLRASPDTPLSRAGRAPPWMGATAPAGSPPAPVMDAACLANNYWI